MGFKVIGSFVAAQQVRSKNVSSEVQVQGQPIGSQHPGANTKVDRELVFLRETRAANASDQVERRVHGGLAAEEDLARQEVVAEGDVVVGEIAVLGDANVRQFLDARQARFGAPDSRFDEQVLGDVVGELHAVQRVGAEVLDAHDSEERADLEILRVDLRRLDFTSFHFGHDDAAGFPLRLRNGDVLRPAMCATSQQNAAQKKNANPPLHSSISSLSLRLVNTT